MNKEFRPLSVWEYEAVCEAVEFVAHVKSLAEVSDETKEKWGQLVQELVTSAEIHIQV